MRIIAVAVLLLGLLMLLGMSFLRINNLEYDVGVLAKEVQKLKASAAAGAPVTPLPVAEPTAASVAPPATPTPPVPAAAGLTVPVEAVTRGFLDEGAEQQVVPFPPRVPRARVTILAIEGDGTGEKQYLDGLDGGRFAVPRLRGSRPRTRNRPRSQGASRAHQLAQACESGDQRSGLISLRVYV